MMSPYCDRIIESLMKIMLCFFTAWPNWIRDQPPYGLWKIKIFMHEVLWNYVYSISERSTRNHNALEKTRLALFVCSSIGLSISTFRMTAAADMTEQRRVWSALRIRAKHQGRGLIASASLSQALRVDSFACSTSGAYNPSGELEVDFVI
jgi:hypothetical protein